MFRKLRSKMISHGVLLLLLAVLPFAFGLYQKNGVLLLLLLLLWPFASFISPFLLTSGGIRWYFACIPVPVFLLIPVCVLLTPVGLAKLGAYPVLYALLSLFAVFLGGRRNARLTSRIKSTIDS